MNQRTSCVFCLFSIILLMLTSCSDLDVISSGRTPLKISPNASSERVNVIEGQSDFYFWGNSPEVSVIDLGEQTNRLGLSRPSNVVLEQSIGWKSFFYSIATLGLYCPVDYKVTILSAKENSMSRDEEGAEDKDKDKEETKDSKDE